MLTQSMAQECVAAGTSWLDFLSAVGPWAHIPLSLPQVHLAHPVRPEQGRCWLAAPQSQQRYPLVPEAQRHPALEERERGSGWE